MAIFQLQDWIPPHASLNDWFDSATSERYPDVIFHGGPNGPMTLFLSQKGAWIAGFAANGPTGKRYIYCEIEQEDVEQIVMNTRIRTNVPAMLTANRFPERMRDKLDKLFNKYYSAQCER